MFSLQRPSPEMKCRSSSSSSYSPGSDRVEAATGRRRRRREPVESGPALWAMSLRNAVSMRSTSAGTGDRGRQVALDETARR